MKIKSSPLLQSSLLLALTLGNLPAQSYSVDWYKVAGGGGTSTGGVYAVSGTLGQADASTPLTGGNYSLTGGFWAITALQTEGAPTLRISRTNNAVTVAWALSTTDWQLDKTTSLTGNPPPWTLVPVAQYQTNATDAFLTVTAPNSNAFFRLRKP